MILKRIGVFSLAKVLGALYAFIGVIVGGFFTIFAVLGVSLDQASGSGGPGPGGAEGAVFGVMALLIFPVMYGVMGFIGGLITGVLFNAVAGMVGGLELTLVTDEYGSGYYQQPAQPQDYAQGYDPNQYQQPYDPNLHQQPPDQQQ
ncbi:MAG: hypothetical protein ACYTGQ_04785 [Planctomycetota bacterium]|jgi:hypothetical protein